MSSEDLSNVQQINENDCCGNGCANCILDIQQQVPTIISRNYSNKTNCLLIYRYYEVKTKEFIQPEILKLKFQLKPHDDENLTLHIPSGHHIMMKYMINRRPYSPYWSDADSQEFEFLVNLHPNGVMSKYIRELKIGDQVEFRGPIGKFDHELNKYNNLLIFTNGIAIAPTIPIIEEILRNDDDITRIQYFGCFTNLDNFYFREKFIDFKQFWNFNAEIYLSREICKDVECKEKEFNNKIRCEHFKKKLKYNENVYNYRLDRDKIVSFGKLNRLENCRVVICGSKEFENFVKNSLNDFQLNKDFIYVL